MSHFFPPNSYGPAPIPVRHIHTSPMEDLIVQQVDWYMGRLNLPDDEYLKQKMDDQLWVSLDVILHFPKMKRIGVTDKHRVATLLSACSKTVQVDENTCRIRPAWARHSSLALHQVPPNVRVEQIIALFHQHSNTSTITPTTPTSTSNPPPTTVQPLSDTSWLAVFDYPTGAKHFLALLTDKNINGHTFLPQLVSDGLRSSMSSDLYRPPPPPLPSQQQSQQPGQVYLPPPVSSRPIPPPNASPISPEHAHVNPTGPTGPTPQPPPSFAAHAAAANPMLSSPMMTPMPLPMPVLHPPHHYNHAANGTHQPSSPPTATHHTQAYIPHSYGAAHHNMPIPRPFMGARAMPPTPAYILPYQTPHFDPAAAAVAHVSMQQPHPHHHHAHHHAHHLPHHHHQPAPSTPQPVSTVIAGQQDVAAQLSSPKATAAVAGTQIGGGGGSSNGTNNSTNQVSPQHGSNSDIRHQNLRNQNDAMVSDSVAAVSSSTGTRTAKGVRGGEGTGQFDANVDVPTTDATRSSTIVNSKVETPSDSGTDGVFVDKASGSTDSRSIESFSPGRAPVEMKNSTLDNNDETTSISDGHIRQSHNKSMPNLNGRSEDSLSTPNYSNMSLDVPLAARPRSEKVNVQRGHRDGSTSATPYVNNNSYHHHQNHRSDGAFSRTMASGNATNGHFQDHQRSGNANVGGDSGQMSHHGRHQYHHHHNHHNHNGGNGNWNNTGGYNGRDHRYSGRNNGDSGIRYGNHNYNHHNHNHHQQHNNHYGNYGHHNRGHQNQNHSGPHSYHHHNNNHGMNNRVMSSSLDGGNSRGFSNNGQPFHNRKTKKGGRGNQQNRQSYNQQDRFNNETRPQREARDTKNEASTRSNESSPEGNSNEKQSTNANLRRQVHGKTKGEPNLAAMDFPPLQGTEGHVKQDGQQLSDISDVSSAQDSLVTGLTEATLPTSTVTSCSTTSSQGTIVTSAQTETSKEVSPNSPTERESDSRPSEQDRAAEEGHTKHGHPEAEKADKGVKNEHGAQSKGGEKIASVEDEGIEVNEVEKTEAENTKRSNEENVRGTITTRGTNSGNSNGNNGLSYAAILRSKKPVKNGNAGKCNLVSISGAKKVEASESGEKKGQAHLRRVTDGIMSKTSPCNDTKDDNRLAGKQLKEGGVENKNQAAKHSSDTVREKQATVTKEGASADRSDGGVGDVDEGDGDGGRKGKAKATSVWENKPKAVLEGAVKVGENGDAQSVCTSGRAPNVRGKHVHNTALPDQIGSD